MSFSFLKSTLFAVAASGLIATAAVADSPWEHPATPAPAPEAQAPAVEQNL